MSYEDTLDYLFNALPAYHRIGAAAYKADLVNTEAMMDHLGHPERGFRSIHVAGTNGKGSVSHFLASILQEAGYKVGLHLAPPRRLPRAHPHRRRNDTPRRSGPLRRKKQAIL